MSQVGVSERDDSAENVSRMYGLGMYGWNMKTVVSKVITIARRSLRLTFWMMGNVADSNGGIDLRV